MKIILLSLAFISIFTITTLASRNKVLNHKIEKLSRDAQIRVNKKEWKKGFKAYQRLAALAQKDKVIDSFVPFAYNNAGFCLQVQNEFDAAISMYDSALIFLTDETQSYELWRNVALYNKACALRHIGKTDSSLVLTKEVYTNCIANRNLSKRMLGITRTALTQNYLASGDTTSAESTFVEIWSETVEAIGEGKGSLRALSNVVTDLATVYVGRKKWEDAAKVYGYIDEISASVEEENRQLIKKLFPEMKITGDYDVNQPPPITRSEPKYAGTAPSKIDGYLVHWRPDIERNYRVARARGIFERERDSLEKSEKLLKDARDFALNYYRSPSIQTIDSYLDLSKLYVKMKENRKASKLVSRAVKDMEKLNGNALLTQETYLNEAIEIYIVLGKEKDAAKLRAKKAK